MRFMVVDDEELIRYSIKNMLESLSDQNIVMEINSAQTMLDELKRFKPEIVFVDIRMPEIDGLEAIRRGKEISPKTQWVVLSGFSEFEYAQKSIQYGVLDYLTKPVNSDELKHVIEKADLEISKSKKDMVRDFMNEILRLLSDYNTLFLENEQNVKFIYGACVLRIDDRNQNVISEILKEAVKRDINTIVEKEVNKGMPVFWLQLNLCEYLIAWKYQDDSEKEGNFFGRIIKKIRKIKDSYCCDTLQITCFYVKRSPTKLLLIKHIRQIQNLLYLRVLIGVGREIDFLELDKMVCELNKNLLSIAENLEVFIESLRDNKYMDGYFALERLRQNCEKSEEQFPTYLKAINKYMACAVQKDIVLSEDYDSWLDKLFTVLAQNEQMISSAVRETSVIDRIKSYIDEHYCEEISVKELASKFYITPNYLSTLFRKKTNSTLSKYIMKLRMFEAKHLLETTDLTVQEICEKVGYQSTGHFTKKFMLYYKCYPTDIRKKKR